MMNEVRLCAAPRPPADGLLERFGLAFLELASDEIVEVPGEGPMGRPLYSGAGGLGVFSPEPDRL